MMILLIVLAIAMYLSVTLRVILCNPLETVAFGIKDIFTYIHYRRWRECKTGTIAAFVGLFGKGKTLSAVHQINDVYKKYNNKRIYDFDRKKWVTQQVHIISNVDLSIPYERFESLAQLIYVADNYKTFDMDNNTLTVHICLGDEFSVQLNSREFKTNIDPLFLNTLLTCRHHHISLYYTSQRFKHVDALLRQVTSYVVSCDKNWRIMVHGKYDADVLEHAANPLDVKPLARYGWFVLDKHYAMYDTLACVQNLSKSCKSGDMLSESEILALQQNVQPDMDNVATPSRSYLRRQKRLNKVKK